MTQQLTVAHLIATNFFGGPEKQIVTHARLLDRSLYRFVLVSFVEKGHPNELLEHAARQGMEIVELHVKHPFDPRAIGSLIQVLRNKGVDLLCSHGYKANIFGRLASWGKRMPHISVSRGWTEESAKIRFYEKLDKIFLRFANHIVAVSGGQKEKIVKLGVRPYKISVIHNGINLEEIPHASTGALRSSLGLPEDAVIIASAGRLSPEKNQAGMIEAARQVVLRNPQAYFIIFGEGFLRSDLERKIKEVGLHGRFLLPGFRSDLQSLLHEIDIFMLPSFTEGLPNVVLEAFAVRKPVVATAVGGTPEVVTHAVSGFLTGPEEIAKMADYVHQLVNDPVLRDCMGENGYRHIKEEFGFERQTRKYEELYLKVASKNAVAESRSLGVAK